MKSIIAAFLTIVIILSPGCAANRKNTQQNLNKYNYEFLGAFDTLIQFVGYANDEKEFEVFSKKAQSRFEELSKLYDIYKSYDGINNIKTINDNAGIKPVKVRQEIIDLLLFSRKWYDKTGGFVNVALGPVLSVWHTYREEGIAKPSEAKLPPINILKEAALKTDIKKVIIDTENKTVFLKEAGMSLDIGAVAKGYATEIVAGELAEAGHKSFIISSGGNVRTVGKPADSSRNKWGIGIQNPDGNPLVPDDPPLDTAYVTDTSVVTSGDYQRFYNVNGVRYNHIIDPDTLMPAVNYRAVTIVTRDSGIADFLSTTAFILPYEKSRKLIEGMKDVAALWIMPDGKINATQNMAKLLKKMGGATNQ